MSVLTKVLRAGEGKKVRRLAELVPLVNDLEPEMEARSDEELRALTGAFRERLANGESPRRPARRSVRPGPGGGLAGARPAPLRRASSWGAWPSTSGGSPR